MRLLVITADRERAEEAFDALEQLEVAVDYLEVMPGAGLEKLLKQLVERLEGQDKEFLPDAVLLYAEYEQSLAKIVRCIRSVLAAPLMVCSGKVSYYQELQCFQAGADDYQSVDCRAVILKLRLQRLLRIYQGNMSGLLMCRGMLENPEERQFYCEEVSLGLTGREYQVLHWLVHSREKVVPRGKLLYHIWGQETPQTSRALDTVVKQLRRKLSGTPVTIRTCYGVGYICDRREGR